LVGFEVLLLVTPPVTRSPLKFEQLFDKIHFAW
jgi:hypothetical protein